MIRKNNFSFFKNRRGLIGGRFLFYFAIQWPSYRESLLSSVFGKWKSSIYLSLIRGFEFSVAKKQTKKSTVRSIVVRFRFLTKSLVRLISVRSTFAEHS